MQWPENAPPLARWRVQPPLLLFRHCYRLKVEGLERNLLRGDQQLAEKFKAGWAAIEGFFSRDSDQVGIIVFLGNVSEDQVACVTVKAFRVAKIFADRMIGKMAGAAEHSLFHDPRIRPNF